LYKSLVLNQFFIKSIGKIKKLDDVFQSEKNGMAVIHFAAFKAVGESVRETLNLGGMKVVGYASAIQVFFLVLSGFIGLFVC
jgi:UDP-glucose 4-epimerase